ncbi:zinc finger protein OZF-like isoform X1 [Ischnura elegans]|uniref:zinc finger protein OZF-like isoform X1 n=2 Tax=Ischnura elegans TaxID=197161 RepID=UPI001ED8A1D4|nr:zinc finger protein OZF-like isoform X1 [Ischnura elegans]
MGSKSLLDKLCRICTAEQDEGIFIFGEEGKRLFLEAKMKKYLYIAVSADDRLPKMVCTNCSKKLESIHRFASMAVEMQDKLTVLVSSASSAAAEPTVKVEQLEGDLPAPYQDGDAMEEVEVRVDPMPFLCAMEAGSGAEDAEGGSGVASPNAEAPDDETAEKLLIEKRKRNRVINKQISSFYRLACKECEGLGVGDGIGEEGVLFETYGDLDAHCLEHHGKRAMIECRICGKVLSSRSKLIAHRLHHMGGFAFRCEICNKGFPLRFLLKKHKALDHELGGQFPSNAIIAIRTVQASPVTMTSSNDEHKPHRCSVCPRAYVSEIGLQNHLWTHFPRGPHRIIAEGNPTLRLNGPLQPAKVELTDGEADKNGIDAVMTSPDSPSQGGCTCPVCGKRLSTKGNLKVHLESHRPKGRHDCDICGRLFKTETNLYRHKEYHKGKQFPCPVCGRVYPTRSTLRAHSITHSDLRPHACPYCEKTFKRNQDLKFHLNQHTGERPYKCPYCPKAFASSGNCFSHRKRMHAKEVERDRAAQVR